MTPMDATILVIDDQPENLKVLFTFLKGRDFQVRVADSGERALGMLERNLPDLILLDVMMAGMDGIETCRRIRAEARTADIPVIFITALDNVDDKVAGFEAGGQDYITKPFQQDEVLARIRTHISLRRKSAALEQALAEIKVLRGILPICSVCKQVRNDDGYWQKVDHYLTLHSDLRFSHGLCPTCFDREFEKLE